MGIEGGVALGEGQKHRLDQQERPSRVIADCLRFGRVRYTPPPDFRFAALQRLTRSSFHQAGCLTREKNRALDLVFSRFSN